MKRNATLSASNSENGLTILVEVKVTSSGGYLAKYEVEAVLSHAIRGIASKLEALPYSDFGIENITVKS